MKKIIEQKVLLSIVTFIAFSVISVTSLAQNNDSVVTVIRKPRLLGTPDTSMNANKTTGNSLINKDNTTKENNDNQTPIQQEDKNIITPVPNKKNE